MSKTTKEQEVRNAIASTWWIPLIQGIAATLFGLYAFTRTAQTMSAIIVILGLYWILNGLFSIIVKII